MILGSLSVAPAQAFVFGDRAQINQWMQAGAGLIQLRSETNNLRIGSSGTLYVNTSGGKVGIGTTAPTNNLEVHGNLGAGASGAEFVVDTNGNITGGNYNGLTLTGKPTGFTVTGGTIGKTLTLDTDLTASALATLAGNEQISNKSFGTGMIWPTFNQDTTGTAAAANALKNPRTINGTSFDGTQNITVAADANTLTGTTLNSNILSSSLTSVGTLANLAVTNPISGSVTGSSGSTAGNAAGLSSQYIDWNSSIGGSSIANKPTLGGMAAGSYPASGIAVSNGSGWTTSITDNSANWNTAFGWGNHALAGYFVKATDTLDNIADGATYKKSHNDFSDTYKGYLNQSVQSGASPTFAGLTLGSLSGVLKAATGSISGSATTADLPDSADKRYVTDAQRTVLQNTSGANTGDQTLSGLGGVPTSRNLTINGTSQDLSSDRTWTISTISGNAATATALAANGTNCSAGSAPLGIDASGNVEGCFSVVTSESDPIYSAWNKSSGISITASQVSDFGAAVSANADVAHGVTAYGWGNWAHTTLSGYGITDALGLHATADAAAKLANPRTINGTSFDGTQNITVTADASTLTGTTLNSSILASSLTSVGTLINLTVTNPIAGSITGSSGSTTGNAAGLTSQYIDWNASLGGNSIANKPTLGSMASGSYPGSGIAVSNGSGWTTSITDNSAHWNTAYGWGNWAHTTLAGYGITDALGLHATADAVIGFAPASGKTLTLNKSMIFTAADDTGSYTFPTGTATLLANALTSANIFVGNGSNVATGVAMSGDVTIDNTGATTIGAAKISLAKMANLAANSIIGNNTGSAATPLALTAAQTKTLLAIAQADVSGLTTGSSPTFAGLALGSGSLTMTGSLGATGTGRLTKGWFTDLDVSNTITGSVSGNAGTVTGFSPALGKTLTVSKTMSFTAADDTGAYTLPTGTATLLANALTSANIFVGNGSNVATGVAMSGDVTIDNTGATTIGAAKISLAKMANLAANSIIGNNTGSPATPLALTVAQTKTLLSIAQADVSGLTTGSSPTFAGLALGSGSLTMTGSLGATGAGRLTKGWFTDLDVSNPISGSVTGSSGSTTGNAATATALAANGSNCSAGSAPLGVDASGNAESCFTVVTTESDPIVKAINGIVKSNGSTIAVAAGTDINTTFGSQTAKYFYAAPNASAGNPGFRAIVASDIPTLNQSTSGTAAGLSAILVPASGGTGVANGTNNTITFSGNYTLGLTLSNNTAVTLPTSGILLANALTSANIFVGNGSNVATGVAMSGDVTIDNTGATIIGAAKVSLAKMANLAANSIIGNNTGSAATPLALTVAQTKTLLAIAQADVSGLTTGSTPTFAGLTLNGNLVLGSNTLTTSNTGAVSNLNADMVDGLHVATGRNNVANQIARTDASGYLQTGYINSSSGDEGNNSSPARVWGTNGGDSYLRTYLTSALSVSNADMTDGYHLNQIVTTAGTPTFAGLTVNGMVTAGAATIGGAASGYYQDAANGAYRALNVTNANYYFQSYNGGASTMLVGLAGTYAGQVGIGTATPTAKLSVVGYVSHDYGTFTFYAGGGFHGGTGSGAEDFSISASNRMTATEFDATSDARVKKNIRQITPDIADQFIDRADPVIFQWMNSEDDGDKFGFLAQDVIKAGFPNLVGMTPDPSLNGYTDADGLTVPDGVRLNLSYEGVVPLLTREEQNLKGKLDNLDLQLDAAGLLNATSTPAADFADTHLGFVEVIRQILAKLGIAIQGGVAQIQKAVIGTARLDKMEMVDQATGDIYCTWIANGEWVKVQGPCDQASANSNAVPAPVASGIISGSGATSVDNVPGPVNGAAQPDTAVSGSGTPPVAAMPISTPAETTNATSSESVQQ